MDSQESNEKMKLYSCITVLLVRESLISFLRGIIISRGQILMG